MKHEKKLTTKSGVYLITNLANNKVYVGSTVNLQKRCLGHKISLKKNEHHNVYLQRAWNKYGKDNFKFEVIEIVDDKEMLLEREQYWMDFYNVVENGYNINPTAGSQLGRKLTDESKKKMSNSNPTGIPVIQLDSNGNFVKRFHCVNHAYKETGISTTAIRNSYNKKNIYMGFVWIREDDYLDGKFNIKEYKEIIPRNRKLNPKLIINN